MIYCINPRCQNRQNPDDLERCQACGSSLIINERYRLVRPLRELDGRHSTEIFEVDNWGTPKVLKVLISNRRRLVELFQQEAQVLQRLRHSGIPRVDTSFIFSPSNGPKELHCLVMEKISGQNLAQWLEENGPIPEALAIDWLRQLVNILGQVHQEQLLHRDIKPSNIMIRPDGQLVLIDFGTVREVTGTYIKKLEGQDVTRVYSPGYTAPEQVNGQAVLQSDFFALGRTFVHLLTGTYPDDLPKDPETNQLIWRGTIPQSALLADLIDELMVPLPQNRLRNPQVILDRLVAAKFPCTTGLSVIGQNPAVVPTTGEERRARTKRNSATGRSTLQNRPISHWRRSLHTVLLASVAIASLVMGVRHLGMLQPLELRAFDQLMRLRPDEGPDPHILIVTIDEADIQYQNQMGMKMRGSLSDQALAQLLEKLEQYQPRTIGLDIYRDGSVDPNHADLATRLRQDDRLFAVCKVPAPEDGDLHGVPPAEDIPDKRLGFSDFMEDNDEIVRRHLLDLTPPITSPCAAEKAFSLVLALHYLEAESIDYEFTPAGELQIGNVVFKRLKPHTAGYQGVNASDYQVLLNYRSLTSSQNIAQQVALRDVLNDRVNPDLVESVKNCIVLIGITAPSVNDYWKTPYSASQLPNNKQIPGVFVQAQMVSHILSAVREHRPLFWWWPGWGEVLWVWGWSLVGGTLAWCIRMPLQLGIAGVTMLGALFGICFGIFTQAGWVPLVPSALALVATEVALVWWFTPRPHLRNSRRHLDSES